MASWLRNAFAIDAAGDATPTAEEAALADRLAGAIARRGLSSPAIMALECSRNLNFIASQTLVFLAPILTILFNRREYALVTQFLERRGCVEYLCKRIELMTDDPKLAADVRGKPSSKRS